MVSSAQKTGLHDNAASLGVNSLRSKKDLATRLAPSAEWLKPSVMKIKTARFQTSVAAYDECPKASRPEFAFVGRSNVGKSSLINMLTNKKELAKTSGVPGKTQQINFFDIDARWHLVDLPGYGFAKVSKAQQEQFNIHVSAYLTQRETLNQVFALVDSRIEPQKNDYEFIAWLEECEVPYSIVFTKTDKSSEGQVQHHIGLFQEGLKERNLEPTMTFKCSAKTDRGRGPILNFIEGKLPKKPKASKSVPTMNLSWMKKK
jgi:GTP-binding protein|tara:strand:- start:3212 stop:3991 length:780 start_codon:yes stop_codon:yes gene_type:complete